MNNFERTLTLEQANSLVIQLSLNEGYNWILLSHVEYKVSVTDT